MHLLTTIILGVLFILLGFSYGKYPRMISGYNVMPENKLQNIDLKSVGKLHKKGFITMGILLPAISGLLLAVGLEKYSIIAQLALIIMGSAIMVIKAIKYNNNTRGASEKYFPILLILLVGIGISVGIKLFSNQPTAKITFQENSIKISGTYGTTIDANNISKIELWDKLPQINRRTNGYDDGIRKKGNFKLHEIGKALLFIQQENPPYLYIEQNDGKKIIFNSNTKEQTTKYYRMIKEMSDI